MRRFLLIVATILFVLFILDFAVLKDDGIVNKLTDGNKYEKARNINDLETGINTGELAPDFTLKNLAGEEISLSDYRGKKVMLNFWASWCGPCRIEMPYMERIHQQYGEAEIAIVGVNMFSTESNLESVISFIDNYSLTFPIPIDEDGELHNLYKIIAYPTTYFIDTDGVIRNKTVGTMDEEYMLNQLERLR